MANKGVLKAKRKIIDEIKTKIKNSSSVLIWEYKTVNVKTISEIKNELNRFGSSSKVYKNTLAKIAFEEEGYKEIAKNLTGQNAFAFASEDDEIANIRIIFNQTKNNKDIKLKVGIFEGKEIFEDSLRELAVLPSREGMISMLLSVLQGNTRNLAYALSQVSNTKIEKGEKK